MSKITQLSSRLTKGLSDLELLSIIKGFGLEDDGFMGIYTLDTLPVGKGALNKAISEKGLAPGKDFSIILNSSHKKDPGEHWQAIYIQPKEPGSGGRYSYAEFFDPYGLPALQPETLKFLEQFDAYESLTQPIQDKGGSVSCGYHCLLWLMAKMEDPMLPFDVFIKETYPLEGRDLELNDTEAVNAIEGTVHKINKGEL